MHASNTTTSTDLGGHEFARPNLRSDHTPWVEHSMTPTFSDGTRNQHHVVVYDADRAEASDGPLIDVWSGEDALTLEQARGLLSDLTRLIQIAEAAAEVTR